MTYLTPNFTLEELIRSEIGARHGIDNTPTPEIIENLKRLAQVLEEVRILLGSRSIYVNSAYRCPEINKLVGSKPTSDHLYGLAADIVCPAFGSPDYVVRAVVASPIQYKQIIREFDAWTHISIPKAGETAQRQALIIDRSGTRPFA